MLLQDEKGLLYEMVQHTGRNYASKLVALAKNHYDRSKVKDEPTDEFPRSSTSENMHNVKSSSVQTADDVCSFDNVAYDVKDDQ